MIYQEEGEEGEGRRNEEEDEDDEEEEKEEEEENQQSTATCRKVKLSSTKRKENQEVEFEGDDDVELTTEEQAEQDSAVNALTTFAQTNFEALTDMHSDSNVLLSFRVTRRQSGAQEQRIYSFCAAVDYICHFKAAFFNFLPNVRGPS